LVTDGRVDDGVQTPPLESLDALFFSSRVGG
jgi:hypothetical protein